MKTLEYTEFRSDLPALTKPRPIHTEDPNASIVYVGLSSFNVPDKVQFSPLPPKGLRMKLSYPDHEKSDGVPHVLQTDMTLTLFLGEHTRKIISVEIADAEYFLREKMGQLPEEEIAALAASLPSRLQKLLTRNAGLINRIMETMPKKYRDLFVHQALHAHVTLRRRG